MDGTVVPNVLVLLFAALGGGILAAIVLVSRARQDKPIKFWWQKDDPMKGRHAKGGHPGFSDISREPRDPRGGYPSPDRFVDLNSVQVPDGPARGSQSPPLEPIEEWKVREFAHQFMTRYPAVRLPQAMDMMEYSCELLGYRVVRDGDS